MKARRLLVITGFALSCVGLYYVGSMGASHEDREPPPPDIVIEGLAIANADLDLGEVWEEPGFTCTLPIRNQTHALIEIEKFFTSCGCVTVEPKTLTIPAHETTTIRLELDLMDRTIKDEGLAKRQLAVEVTPVLKTGKRIARGWILQTLIKSRVTLKPIFVHFGESAIEGQPTAPRKVEATVHRPIHSLEARVDCKVATVTARRKPDSANQFELEIAPQPTLHRGRFESKVVVDLIGPEGNRLPGATLPIYGQVQPEVRPLPAQLLLGVKPVGTTAETSVVFQRPPGTVWVVDHIEVDSLDVQVFEEKDQKASNGQTFRVRQKITRLGDQTSTIRFIFRKGEGELLTHSMKVCFHGALADKASGHNREGEVP